MAQQTLLSTSWIRSGKRILCGIAAGWLVITGVQATELKVAATVRKHASLQVLAQPGSVQITEADIARGYVEVKAPVQVAVQSNTREGYVLVFDSHGDFFRHARVRGLAGEVQVGPAGGTVAQKQAGPGMNRVTLTLAFRFELAQDTREGVYAWPMQLSALPL